MSAHSELVSSAVGQYLRQYGSHEPPVLARLREQTAKMPNGGMQISPEQGQLMRLLVHLIGARRCLEVGVFTGYSSLSVALALPEDGHLVACDISEEYTAVARRHWQEAGVAHKIELRIGAALETLDTLLAAGQAGRYDFAFIDADKSPYPDYFDRALKLVRAGGLIAVDNTLWSGEVANPRTTDATARTLHAFNQKLHADGRVEVAMIPIGDGFTLAWKKS
ncbi:MAG: SAM-dependent methyltransferase [Candidimonas sp.]|nr:MAG: SAM-dependent methyltransferase [Candidimonas sp.]